MRVLDAHDATGESPAPALGDEAHETDRVRCREPPLFPGTGRTENSKRALLPTAPSVNGTDAGSARQPGGVSTRSVPATDGAPAVSSTEIRFGSFDGNSSTLASGRTDTAGVISTGGSARPATGSVHL